MIVSGRVLGLVLAGAVPVLVRPQTSTVWLWMGVVLLLVVVDLLLTGSPTALGLRREPISQVRLGDATTTTLLVGNPGSRTFRGRIRDAWQPSAGAGTNRHAITLPAGERRGAAVAAGSGLGDAVVEAFADGRWLPVWLFAVLRRRAGSPVWEVPRLLAG